MQVTRQRHELFCVRRYGNVSSSSIWYVLAQIETTQVRFLGTPCTLWLYMCIIESECSAHACVARAAA